VETAEQFRQLRALDCPLVQGFLLARPQPADQVELILFPARPVTQTSHVFRLGMDGSIVARI
jgi:predicted signal transduction protein with EAL and GGDEF domain